MIDLSLFLHLSTFEYTIIALLFLSFVIQQLYIWNVYGRVAFYKKKNKPTTPVEQEGVSVIICVRNEKELLEQHLPLFLAQDYPKFEIIVVNDCSEDDSELMLGIMKSQYPNLEARHIPKDDTFKHGKPMALGVGIKAAKYDWILFSEIDCIPSTDWLSSMQENFTEKTSVVLGYASNPKSSKYIRSNMFFHALHYLGFALMNKTYMANDKNYAYRRKLFFDSKGFDIRMKNERENIVFISKIASKSNTIVELRPQSLLKSSRSIARKDWRQYKIARKASFNFHSSKKRNPALLSNLSMFLFIASVAVLGTMGLTFSIVASAFVLLHFVMLISVLAKASKKLMERKLLFSLIFYSIIAPFASIASSLQQRK